MLLLQSCTTAFRATDPFSNDRTFAPLKQSDFLDADRFWESQGSLSAYQQQIHSLMVQTFDLVNTDYRYGGNTPEEGFDCSGLVQFLFQENLGIDLPRTTRDQQYVGDPVNQYDLRLGDLVFFNTQNRPFSHVGIYVGENQFIHAPGRGKKVRVTNMQKQYWKKRYNGARRVIPLPENFIHAEVQ